MKIVALAILVFYLSVTPAIAGNIDVDAFCFPSWKSDSPHWKSLDNFLDRWPLLGIYPEEDPRIVERHEANADKFGMSYCSLLELANAKARSQGHEGFYFVAITNAQSSDGLETQLQAQGYDAYMGWNYVVSEDASANVGYESMVETYRRYDQAAAQTAALIPYIAPASPDWDTTHWRGLAAIVRTQSTPRKFESMLKQAKGLRLTQKARLRH